MKNNRLGHYAELDLYLKQNGEKPDRFGHTKSEMSEMSSPEVDAYKGSGKTFDEPSDSLEDLISQTGESFHQMLMRRIKKSGMSESEVYKRANLDRKLFSKIKNNPAYHPGKDTVEALAVALRMNRQEAEDFLARAEYAFSPHSRRDLIVRYYLEKGIYDIDTINMALDDHALPVLGHTDV